MKPVTVTVGPADYYSSGLFIKEGDIVRSSWEKNKRVVSEIKGIKERGSVTTLTLRKGYQSSPKSQAKRNPFTKIPYNKISTKKLRR